MAARVGGSRAPLAVLLLAGVWATGGDSPRLWAADSQTAGPKGAVTYSKDIAPILNENCAACHRPGEIGPFSLLSYADAQKRAEFIAEVTADKRMPPWKAEPGVARFRDERHLTAEQVKLLADWAKAGAPEGDPAKAPKPPVFSDGWQLGEPDMVLKMPQPFSVPAGGNDVYRCFVVPIPLDEDRMVSAVEFRPGNSRVVHHAIMFLDSKGQARERDGKDGQPGFPCFGTPGIIPTGGLGAWAPGAMPHPLPARIAKYVQKSSDLVLQVHYHPSGKPETDQSTVGLYFSKKPAQRVVTGVAIIQPELKLPAGEKQAFVRAISQRLPTNVHVLGVSPHMHNLGKQIRVVAVDPSGRRSVPLIWIKDWDFNWQGAYSFERPIRLPKGSRIRVEAVYDNSAENPKNPNKPPKEIKWGEGTNDEMCLVTVQVFTDTVEDMQAIAKMPAYELAAGIEGGVPGVDFDPAAAALALKGEGAGDAAKQKPADAATKETASSEPAVADQPPMPEKANARSNKTAKAAADIQAALARFPADGMPVPSKVPFFKVLDKDQDGNISKAEIQSLPPQAQQDTIDRLLKAAAE